MGVNKRAQDILIGAIFGLVLGVVCNLWSSVFDRLFFENASKEMLYFLFIIYSLGIIGLGVFLWKYIGKLNQNEETDSNSSKISTCECVSEQISAERKPKKISEDYEIYIGILLNEYQACHRERNHYDSIRWTMGSLFIAAALALFGASFGNSVMNDKEIVPLLGCFSFLLIVIWYLYNQHVNPWVLSSIIRFHEIEQELRDLGANIRLHLSVHNEEPKIRGINITLSFFYIVIISWYIRFNMLFKENTLPLTIIFGFISILVYCIHTRVFNTRNIRKEIRAIVRNDGANI